MKTSVIKQSMSLLALTVLWTAALFMVVSIGGTVLLLTARSSLPAPLVAGLLAVTVLFAIIRHQSRESARRQQAALDAYVERELARLAMYGGGGRSGLAPATLPVLSES